MPVHPKVKAVGYVAIVYVLLLALQAATKTLPSGSWEIALEAGIAPPIAFIAGWVTPGPSSGNV